MAAPASIDEFLDLIRKSGVADEKRFEAHVQRLRQTGAAPADAEGRRQAAVQLGVYRLAWAALRGCPPEQVRAAFHYVRTGQTVIPDDLPTAAELLRMVGEPAA